MSAIRWPSRIYKRRAVWHWLADAGAPEWLWSLFCRSTWRQCATCGPRGIGRFKRAATFGGGESPRLYCSTAHYYEREPF